MKGRCLMTCMRHHHNFWAMRSQKRRRVSFQRMGALTLGLLVSMLYHKMDAQAFGIWQMLEITTTGKEWVCGASGR